MGLLDDLKSQVSNTWNDVTQAGVPAVIAGVDSYAAQQLQAQAQTNQAQAQAATAQIVAQPGPSSGIMQSIDGMFKNIASNQVMKQYGVFIVVGAIAAIILIRKM